MADNFEMTDEEVDAYMKEVIGELCEKTNALGDTPKLDLFLQSTMYTVFRIYLKFLTPKQLASLIQEGYQLATDHYVNPPTSNNSNMVH